MQSYLISKTVRFWPITRYIISLFSYLSGFLSFRKIRIPSQTKNLSRIPSFLHHGVRTQEMKIVPIYGDSIYNTKYWNNKVLFINTALLKNKIIISFVKLLHKPFVSWNKKSSLEYTFNSDFQGTRTPTDAVIRRLISVISLIPFFMLLLKTKRPLQ